MPKLEHTLDEFEDMGAFTITGSLGIGETEIQHELPVAAGAWRAYFLDADSFQYDDDEEPDEYPPSQLLLVREGASPPPALQELRADLALKMSIEAARFMAVDSSMKSELATTDGFHAHLDGVHGVLANKKGVHVALGGDGSASVWRPSDPRAGWILINLA